MTDYYEPKLHEGRVDYRSWAIDLCSLLDEIDCESDDEARDALLRHRFSIAEKYGMTVEFIGDWQRTMQ